MRPTLRRLVPAVLVPALVFGGFALPTEAREAPVQITVGQPNIWSLEQAHYLLAQMHERSASLKAKLPGEDILDPAGLHGQTLDLLRTAVSAELSYDESLGVANRLEFETFEHESARRRQLQAQLDAARARQATLTTEIAQHESRRTAMAAGLPAGTTTPELKTLDATIASMKAEKSGVDGQVSALTNELATLATDPELESSAPDPSATLPDHALAGFLAALQLGTPKLHPSVVLDNFVQFQYEIIAKQLSLLRDELDEGERLVFLELPQAVYAVPGRSEDYLVRTSWRVDGYFLLPDSESGCRSGALDRRDSADAAGKPAVTGLPTPADGAPQITETVTEGAAADYRRFEIAENRQRLPEEKRLAKEARRDAGLSAFPNTERKSWEELRDEAHCWFSLSGPEDDDAFAGRRRSRGKASEREGKASASVAFPELSYRRARVLDLIPRTLAVNLDATTASSKASSFTASLGTLGGLGAGLALERQHDLAERLVEQQVFAAGFGRGNTTFGWVFAPPPGSDRLHPGDKTTYAVLAVPEEAVLLRLQAERCSFHRSRNFGEPFAGRTTGLFARSWRDCDERPITYDLRVPGHESDLYHVKSIAYSGVAPGERVTVFVRGSGFSPQTGVLVNGTPLGRSLSLAAEKELPAAKTEATGLFEIVNGETVVLSFSMPAGYVGTPLITLVSPGKSAPINYYRRMQVNDRYGSLAAYSRHHPMFRPLPQVVTARAADCATDCVEILGSGFRDGSVALRFNGHPCKATFVSPTRYYAIVPAAVIADQQWEIRYTDKATQGVQEATATVANPLLPRVPEMQVVAQHKVKENGNDVLKYYDVLFTASGFVPQRISALAPRAGTKPAIVDARGDGRYYARITDNSIAPILEVCGLPSRTIGGGSDCTLYSFPKAPAPPPRVHVVEPASVEVGKAHTRVTLRGANFGSVKEVSFGTAVAEILVSGETELVVEVPKSDEPGPVRVVLVADHQGKKVDNRADLDALFTYEPAKK